MPLPTPERIRQTLHRLAAVVRSHSQPLIFLGTVAGTLAIFATDLVLPADVRLHGLYVFPLAIVARYCARMRCSIAVLLLTTTLQYIAYSIQIVSFPSLISDLVAPAATSVLILFLARAWRLSYMQVASQATVDPLTGIGNRRAFFRDLDAEITRQRHRTGTFSLAVLDLDGFKALNDSKGHHAGDEALKLVGDILHTRTRRTDSVGRIGGDEFGILMPDTDEDCSALLQDVCATIACRTAAAGYAVTTSIGCKTFRAPPKNTADALQQADTIMYQAKMRDRSGLAARARARVDQTGT